MKLLITSVDAIIDITTGTYFKGIKESLKYFESLDKGNKVYIISIDENRLDEVPDDFSKLVIRHKRLRSSPELIRIISERTKMEYNDIYILGAKDSDMILAANAKAENKASIAPNFEPKKALVSSSLFFVGSIECTLSSM